MKKLHYIFSAVLIAVSLFFFMYSSKFKTLPGQQDIGPSAFPKFVCVCLIICAVLLVLQQRKETEEEPLSLFNWKWGVGVATAIGFYMLLPHLGFVITGIVAIFIMECLLLNESFKKALPIVLGVAIVVPIVIQIIFGQFLKVPLPTGILSGLLR